MSYQQTLLLIRKFLLTYHSPISSFHLKRINSEVKKIILELTWTTLHKNKAKLRNNPLGFGSFANWPLGFQFCNIIGPDLSLILNPTSPIFTGPDLSLSDSIVSHCSRLLSLSFSSLLTYLSPISSFHLK